jgi:DNA-binding FadR family transcriptional regulator
MNNEAVPELSPLQRSMYAQRSEKVSMAVARSIVREIAAKKLLPGTPLPSEQMMADEYGVGRASIREALRVLEAQGLIVIRAGSGGGPLVGRPTGADFGRTMTMFLQILDTPVSHVLESLIAIEGVVTGLAATRVAEGRADAARLFQIVELERVRRNKDAEEFKDSTIAFHTAIEEMVDNNVTSLLQKAMTHVYIVQAVGNRLPPDYRDHIVAEHLAIAKAVSKGNVAASIRLGEAHARSNVAQVLERYPAIADEMVDWR